ncbi:MAG: hypothetical protein QNJ15_02500 [Erythrobacter sp.]|nr:hypothetical protein [Erythrobacter sp.]
MITVSDDLYASYQERDFYYFLFDFLNAKSTNPGLRAALADRARAREFWKPYFDPQGSRMDMALRHAYALGRELLGEPLSGAIPEDVTNVQMKALLDGNGFVPFSAFDRRDD